MDSGNPAARGTGSQGRAAGRRKDPPLLEGSGLYFWLLVADAVAVMVFWLLMQRSAGQAALLHVGIFSLAAFLLFGLDKWRARGHRRRVSEWNLLAMAFTGGALGGLLAMVLFRHKTRPARFRLGVPVALFLQLVMVIIMFFQPF